MRGPRRLLAAGDRLGHRRSHACRPGRVRCGDGGRDARRAGGGGDLPRRPRLPIHQFADRFADRHNLTRSVGRTGVCWDNAAAESFWATLKVELYDRYLWPTRAAAKLAVGDWIERIYNRRRRHSAIGMISPVEYENRFN